MKNKKFSRSSVAAGNRIAQFSRSSVAAGNRIAQFSRSSAAAGLSILLLIFLCGCANEPQKDSAISILVPIEPIAYFVDKIGGEHVSCKVLVPTGKEPETYMPSPEQIAAIARCRLFFTIGFPSEETFIPKLKTIAPKLKIVDGRSGITLRELEAHTHSNCHEIPDSKVGKPATTGEYEAGGAAVHTDYGIDPHFWLSPTVMKQFAETVRKELTEIDPENSDFYQKNAVLLTRELDSLRNEIAKKLEKHKGETIYVFHPAYGYFCDEFALKQKAIEIEGHTPSASDLANWVREAGQSKNRLILVQPEFNELPARRIAEAIGGKVIQHSTLSYEYPKTLMELAEIISPP